MWRRSNRAQSLSARGDDRSVTQRRHSRLAKRFDGGSSGVRFAATPLLVACFLVFGFGFSVAANANDADSVFVRKPCSDLGFSAKDFDGGVECGIVRVKESSKTPHRMLDLAVVVARAKNGSSTKEPVLYLHGGPGIATSELMPRALKGKSWPLLRQDHDVVFFDQRGTGRSKPQICPTFDKIASAKTKDKDKAAKFERLLAAAGQCRVELDSLGVDHHAYGSTAIANDVEAVRKALGITSWNVFATSFGSLPAAELIRHYPETVRAVFLDSAFSVNSPNRAERISATVSSVAAFQRRCSADKACLERYPDIRGMAATTIARLDANPLVLKSSIIDGEQFVKALWAMMVDGKTSRLVPELLMRASKGDDAMLRRFVPIFASSDYFGKYAYAQAWLVNCHDIFLRPSKQLWAAAIAQNSDVARGFVADEQDRICDSIQPAHADDEFYQPLKTTVPTLIMFGEFDPATPLSDAKAAQVFFREAKLLEIDGKSHAPFYSDQCTRDMVVMFFDNPRETLDTGCIAQRPAFTFASAEEFEAFLAEFPK